MNAARDNQNSCYLVEFFLCIMQTESDDREIKHLHTTSSDIKTT